MSQRGSARTFYALSRPQISYKCISIRGAITILGITTQSTRNGVSERGVTAGEILETNLNIALSTQTVCCNMWAKLQEWTQNDKIHVSYFILFLDNNFLRSFLSNKTWCLTFHRMRILLLRFAKDNTERISRVDFSLKLHHSPLVWDI